MKKKIETISSESLAEFNVPMVALFENCYSSSSIDEVPITEFLFTKKYKTPVETYRASRDSRVRDKIKLNLECITPSSTCRYRREDYFNQIPISKVHTGLICIDIDSQHNPDVDLDASKHIIGRCCPTLYYAGLSVGGEGIFLLFRISDMQLHKQHFNALVYYLKAKFNLNADRAVQNPVSLRIASYDENPYYNPNPSIYKHTMDIQNSPMPIRRTESEKQETRENIKNVISSIKTYRIDITEKYHNWFKIGAALAHGFGEEGREWFHEVSKFHHEYDKCICDFEYDKCLKYKKGKVKIGTFFHYCKMHGIEYWKKEGSFHL